MLSNKVRNDSWWLLKCFDYLAGPLQMADQNRNNFLDFRRVIEERMTEYSREIESLEAKLKEEKEKAHRVSLEITEKPPVTTTQAAPIIQHANQFLEVLEPAPAPARVTVTKEVTMKAPTPVTSPVKPKVVVPLPPTADEPEEAEEDEPEEAEEAEPEETEEEEEEEEEEPEPEENYEQIRIKKTNYWLETISRKVYQITADGEVGDLVANYKLVNGVATLAPL